MADEYPIGVLKIKPHEQLRLLLGSFLKESTPRGFTVYITPASEHEHVTSSVVAQDKSGGRHNLVMNIENVGSKTVKAVVWPI